MFIKSEKEYFSSSIDFYENVLAFSNFHNNVEILYVSSGGMRFSVNTSEYIVNEGEFIVIFPFEIHKSIELFGDTKNSCIAINVNRLDGYSPLIRKHSLKSHIIKANKVSTTAKNIYSLIVDETSQNNENVFTALTVALFLDLISCGTLIPRFNLKKAHTKEKFIPALRTIKIIHLVWKNYQNYLA